MVRGVIQCYSELKYDNSRPMALTGLEVRERLETTPRLTRRFRIRPSHIRDTSCAQAMYKIYGEARHIDCDYTVDVDTFALTTPVISSNGCGFGVDRSTGGNEGCEGSTSSGASAGVGESASSACTFASSTGFTFRLVHHSAPSVNSLS